MTSKEKISIYDLNNPYYLYEDVDAILEDISNLYQVNFGISLTEYIPKTLVPKEFHWISDESTSTFNKLIPKIKSITKDMYSVIEGVYKAKRNDFKKLELEKEYPYLKELRLLNNKLKHHKNQEADIKFTKIAILSTNGNLIDCYLQFNYYKTKEFKIVRFADLIDVFLRILETEKIITIERK